MSLIVNFSAVLLKVSGVLNQHMFADGEEGVEGVRRMETVGLAMRDKKLGEVSMMVRGSLTWVALLLKQPERAVRSYNSEGPDLSVDLYSPSLA